MKLLEVKPLALPDVKVLRMQRFVDNRGYFIEAFRTDQLMNAPELPVLAGKSLSQINESFSVKNVMRGLHTQSSPDIDKMLRVLNGRIIDVAVDIRPNSATYGQAVAYELFYDHTQETEELILIPFGFAHGIVALKDAHIQYFQTGFWNAEGEVTVQFFDEDIDWSTADPTLVEKIKATMAQSLLSDKDKQGVSLTDWKSHPLAAKY